MESLFEYDTKNGISFWVWFKESNSFLNTTQRMKRFFRIRLNESNPFLNTTQRIEPSLTWLEKCFFFFEKKKWNFLSMSQRIEFLSFLKKKKNPQRIQLFSKIRYKELNKNAQRIEPLFHMNYFYMTQRIEYESNIFLNESKSWTPFWIWLKELTPFSLNMTQRIEPFFFFNITQRIEPLLSMIQRIESLSEYDSKKIELFFFLNTTQWIEPIFLNVSQIEIFGWKIVKKKTKLIFSHDPKNRTRFFSIWLKELNLFRLDSKIRCYSV